MKDFHFGENLRTLRKARGIMQDLMAQQLRMSQSSYSRLESRTTIPDAQLIKEIAKVLQVRTATLKSPMPSGAFGLVSVVGKAEAKQKIKDMMHFSAGWIIILGASASFVSTVFDIPRGFLTGMHAPEAVIEWVSWTLALSALVYVYYVFKNIRKEG